MKIKVLQLSAAILLIVSGSMLMARGTLQAIAAAVACNSEGVIVERPVVTLDGGTFK